MPMSGNRKRIRADPGEYGRMGAFLLTGIKGPE